MRFDDGAVITMFADGPAAGISRVLYCADVDVRFDPVEFPVELASVKVAVIDKAPAMDVSRYSVSPLFVVSPHVPDSVPVTGKGRFNKLVRLIVMFGSPSSLQFDHH